MLAGRGDLLALGPSVPTAPILPPPAPHSWPWSSCPRKARGAQAASPGEAWRVGGCKGTVTPWRLLPTAPSAPSLQPGEADGPALGLGRLFFAHHHDPLLHGGRDWLESASPTPSPCS